MKILMIVFGPAGLVIAVGALAYLRDWFVRRRKAQIKADAEALIAALRVPYKVEKPSDPSPNRRDSDKTAANRRASERRKNFHIIK